MRNGARILVGMVSAIVLAACSHEGADWKAATAADTTEAYAQFLKQYPNSGLAQQAQARVKQLTEDHDWQAADVANTRDAYEQFITQHPDSKWTQEARVRLENFAQTPATTAPTAPGDATASAPAPTTPPVRGTPIEHPAPAPAPEPAPAPSEPKPAPIKPAAHAMHATHAAHAAVTHAHVASRGGSHRVQLGAYRSKASAEQAWRHLEAKYGHALQGHTPHVVAAKGKSGTIYRLQIGTASESAAKELCADLRHRGQACVRVSR